MTDPSKSSKALINFSYNCLSRFIRLNENRLIIHPYFRAILIIHENSS